MELKLQPAIKIDPDIASFRFTRRDIHLETAIVIYLIDSYNRFGEKFSSIINYLGYPGSETIWSPDSRRFILLDNTYPGDDLSQGRRQEGHLLATANVSPSAVADLILVTLGNDGFKIGRAETGVCHGPGENRYVNLHAASFGKDTIEVDIGKKMTLPYAAFAALK